MPDIYNKLKSISYNNIDFNSYSYYTNCRMNNKNMNWCLITRLKCFDTSTLIPGLKSKNLLYWDFLFGHNDIMIYQLNCISSFTAKKASKHLELPLENNGKIKTTPTKEAERMVKEKVNNFSVQIKQLTQTSKVS